MDTILETRNYPIENAMKTEPKSLIDYYESRLQKVRAHWLTGAKEGSWQWERAQEYVKHAESELAAVRNGRDW